VFAKEEEIKMLITRRHVLIGTAGAASFFVIPAFGQVPPLKKKDHYKVGFAQTESNNPWRLAQTASMKDEAAKRGDQLVYTDAAGSAAKQVADVNSMIAQGVDFIFLAPREEKPLATAVLNAKKAGIPVLAIDRDLDQAIAKRGQDYLAFIGSNFIQEGQRVADWTIAKTGGKGKIIELEGTIGSSPANDRKKGFDDQIKAKAPELVILASQSGDFARDKGRQVAETLLQAHPDATIVYAHNDEMALGAIAAIEAAGKVPGKDILVVSIDGEKDGLQAIADGKLGCSCECNPRFGPAAFDILYKYAGGETIPASIINPDNFYDASNVAAALPTAY
jgi:ribose transport system substrate-binding protein